MYTPKLHACNGDIPCANREDTIPANTSPLPPLAIPEFAVLSIYAQELSAIIVLAPFNTKVQSYLFANSFAKVSLLA